MNLNKPISTMQRKSYQIELEMQHAHQNRIRYNECITQVTQQIETLIQEKEVYDRAVEILSKENKND